MFSFRDDLDDISGIFILFWSVIFGLEFFVWDDDVIKVVDFCKDNLVVLEFGFLDIGIGVWLLDVVVYYIVSNCFNLCKFCLEFVIGVIDVVVIDVMYRCLLMEELEVSGYDCSLGFLMDECIKCLFDMSVLLNLKGLIIID